MISYAFAMAVPLSGTFRVCEGGWKKCGGIASIGGRES